MNEYTTKVTFTEGYTSPLKTKIDPDAAVTPTTEKTYEDADDKHVAAKLFYWNMIDENEGYLYFDAEKTVEVTLSDAIPLLFDKIFVVTSVSDLDGSVKRVMEGVAKWEVTRATDTDEIVGLSMVTSNGKYCTFRVG